MRKDSNWENKVEEGITLLGHRNWIVITDMAYPLQSQPGIDTLFTNESYEEVLKTVFAVIKNSPHVYANIYQDAEINLLKDSDLNGVDEFKKYTREILGEDIIYKEHEQLIAKLDEVAKVFNVIILKTTLTIPYTTTFFELDCKYWDAQKQKILDSRK